MGSDQSQFREPLRVQPEPICATEPRFCLPNPVQLHLREKLWSYSGDDFDITDFRTGIAYFKCDGKTLSLREKKILLDNFRYPVLNLQKQLFSFTDTFIVYEGADDTIRQICKFSSSITFAKAKLKTVFKDVVTQKQRNLVLKGDWRNKRCLVFLGDSDTGIPIAKIFRPTTGRSILHRVDDYVMEIAAGVDIALLVIMCIALDEHKRD